MGFPRRECWGRLPFSSPGHLPDARIKPTSPARQANSLPLSHQGSPSWVSQPLQMLSRRGDTEPWPQASAPGWLLSLAWAAHDPHRQSGSPGKGPAQQHFCSAVTAWCSVSSHWELSWGRHLCANQRPGPPRGPPEAVTVRHAYLMLSHIGDLNSTWCP